MASLILGIIFSIIIAYFLGKRKQIGIIWSFILCVFLSPILGVIVTICSPSIDKLVPDKSFIKIAIGILLAIFGVFRAFTLPTQINRYENVVIMCIGVAIGGVYLVLRGYGLTFNKRNN